MRRLVALSMVAVFSMSAAQAAARAQTSKRPHLTMARAKRAIRDYAKPDHAASVRVHGCRRSSRTRVACTLNEHSVCTPGIAVNGSQCGLDVAQHGVTAALRSSRIYVWFPDLVDNHPFSEAF